MRTYGRLCDGPDKGLLSINFSNLNVRKDFDIAALASQIVEMGRSCDKGRVIIFII